MKPFEKLFAYSETHRARVLSISAALVVFIALVDWKVQPNVSLGVLYVIPILLGAGSLSRWQIVAFSAVCTILREIFGPFHDEPGMAARLTVVLGGFAGAGLLFSELSRNRRLVIQHLRLREEAEQQLRVLIETSPLAILTLDGDGRVLLANASANQLLGFDSEPIQGRDIRPYLPILGRPLRRNQPGQALRTAVECRGRRRDGEVFLAHIWFSTYGTASGLRLATVVWDQSEHLRDREGAGLDSMMATSRVLIGALSHEVRNLAAAAASAYGNLDAPPELAQSKDFQALGALVKGLERIASSGLRMAADRKTPTTDLHTVLDEARIVIEPSFRECEINTAWEIDEAIPLVQADHQSLLQVFLNLARNSERAMERSGTKQFTIEAGVEGDLVMVRFRDTGCGVANPDRLFRPFQAGAEETGVGLYVSRAILRSCDGDLRYEPQPTGSCFVVELRPAEDNVESGA